jgi:hypothetical protein
MAFVWSPASGLTTPGEWKETTITPDLWQVGHAVTKRRAGRGPEGSGVPVGTKYHWRVLAHQNVAGRGTARLAAALGPLASIY